MGSTERLTRSSRLSFPNDLTGVFLITVKEIEARACMLGVTLNDAFSEREQGRHQMSWHVVRLAVGEWDRLFTLVTDLQATLVKFLPDADPNLPVRRVALRKFKSRAMRDTSAFHEFFDQIMFGSKRRFGLQLRLLSRGSVQLTKDFRRVCREGERTLDSSNEAWNLIDCSFHDFDLLAKETLITLRTLLPSLSAEKIEELSTELHTLIGRTSRVSVAVINQ